MDKITFLRELEKGLSILQKDELEDIISEYEQHIDMKIESGLPEEEAISDFGNLEELTAEILEVYHVRSDYADKCQEEDSAVSGKGSEYRKLWPQAVEGMKRTGRQAVRLLCRLRSFLCQVFIFWGRQFGRPFRWAKERWSGYRNAGEYSGMPDRPDPEEPGGEEDGARENRRNAAEGGIAAYESLGNTAESSIPYNDPDNIRTDGTTAFEAGRNPGGEYAAVRPVTGETEKRPPYPQNRLKCRKTVSQTASRQDSFLPAFFQRIARAGKASLRTCKKAMYWGVGIMWNVFWLVNIGICLLLGLFSLFALGLLVVLMLQHYPILGALIGCIGMTMCLFSFAWLGVTFMWRPGKARIGSGDRG